MAEDVSPAIDALNRPFWDAADADRLVLPHCIATGAAFWPPSPISPFTGGAVAWRDVEPSGTIVGRVVFRRVFQPAFAGGMPFGVALVALDSGPRLQVHVADADGGAAPRAGDRVTIRFQPILAGGRTLPVATTL